VGVLQEGVVQAVKVLATEQVISTIERAAYHGALSKLAGTDLGEDVAPWKQFWAENGDRLLQERADRNAKRKR
jgi:hypothetical protein